MYPRLESRADLLRLLADVTAKRKQFLELCGRLRPEQLRDPVYPGTWSVLQILAHLAWAEEYMLAWIRKRPGELPHAEYPPEPPPELDALRTALDEAHAAVLAFLKANPEEVLKEPCRYGRRGEQTVGSVLCHLVLHEVHHRAFLVHKIGKLLDWIEDD